MIDISFIFSTISRVEKLATMNIVLIFLCVHILPY